MPRFVYKAKKSPEEIMEGNIEADSENVAANKLIQSGYYPVWIREELANEKNLTVFKVKAKDLANFTRQLSELIGSNLALYNALSVIENQTESNYLKIIVGDIKLMIKEGKAFSEALKKYPDVFSELYVNLVRSGEKSGSLNEVLANIKDFLDKDQDTRERIIAALAYPGLMAIVGFVTIFVLVTFVVPRIASMFVEMNEKLPLPTRMLIDISDFARTYWFLLIIFIIGAIFLFKTGKTNPVTKNKMDKFKLKIPIFGNLLKNTEFARFSRTLSMLLKNGVPILDSLKITASVITNSVIKEEVDEIYKDVKAGSSFTLAIKKRKNFPIFVANMTAVGEEGGFLDRALLNIARNYETEVERLMKIITALLEPGFILIMGLVVGLIVMAMILPVFQMSLAAY
ncbi:MAG: type II secretion system F family protein [Candidatus Omnitrophica bacterium]|nr:type II secretion system F family protein [Candidatus Omnitrophota bacterium]